MTGRAAARVHDLDEAAFQSLYGRWDPLEPAQAAELFAASSMRWWIAGGRAARAGAPDRRHEDIDVVVRFCDLDELRQLLADWPPPAWIRAPGNGCRRRWPSWGTTPGPG